MGPIEKAHHFQIASNDGLSRSFFGNKDNRNDKYVPLTSILINQVERVVYLGLTENLQTHYYVLYGSSIVEDSEIHNSVNQSTGYQYRCKTKCVTVGIKDATETSCKLNPMTPYKEERFRDALY